MIVGKEEYLKGLATVVDNPYESLETRVRKISIDKDSAVVEVLVVTKRKNMERPGEFKNVRVFSRQNGEWKLAAWIITLEREL